MEAHKVNEIFCEKRSRIKKATSLTTIEVRDLALAEICAELDIQPADVYAAYKQMRSVQPELRAG